MSRSVVAFAFLSLMVSVPIPVKADDSSVLAVATAGSDLEERRLLWAVRGALGETHHLQNINLPSLLDVDFPHSVEMGRQRAQEGFAALDEFELIKGKALLEEASLYLSGHSEARDDACAALKKLAEVELGLGNENAVVRTLVRALRVGSCIDERHADELSPSMARLRTQAESVAARRDKGRLSIDARGVPFAVIINGHFTGMIGRNSIEIPAGPNHVRLAADGYGDVNRFVTVRAGTELQISVRPRKASRAGLLGRILRRMPEHIDDETFPAGLLELKALSFSQQGILVERRGGYAEAALYDLKRNQRLRVSRVSARGAVRDVAHALVRALYSGFDPRRPGLSVAPPEIKPTARDHTSEGVPTWLWYAAGGALVVVTGALILSGEDEEEGVRRDPGTGSLILRF